MPKPLQLSLAGVPVNVVRRAPDVLIQLQFVSTSGAMRLVQLTAPEARALMQKMATAIGDEALLDHLEKSDQCR
jgi:hypothetical protein